MPVGNRTREVSYLGLKLLPLRTQDRQVRSGGLNASLKLTLKLLKGVRGDIVPQNLPLKPFDDFPLDRIPANHQSVRADAPILMEWAAVLGQSNPASARYQHHVRSTQAATSVFFTTDRLPAWKMPSVTI